MADPITLSSMDNDRSKSIMERSLDRISQFNARQPMQTADSLLNTTRVDPITGGINQVVNSLVLGPQQRALAEANKLKQANTGNIISQLDGIKTNESFLAQQDNFSDEAIASKYGENVNIDRVRGALKGKLEQTQAYSFDKGIDALMPQLGTMSTDEVNTATTQLAHRYDQDATNARTRIAQATAVGQGNTNAVQRENIALAKSDTEYRKADITSKANKRFSDGLQANKINPEIEKSVYNPETDVKAKSDYWASMASSKGSTDTKNAKDTVAQIEAKYGPMSYADLVLIADSEDSFIWGDPTLHVNDKRRIALQTKLHNRNKNIGKYNQLKADRDLQIKSDTDRATRDLSAYVSKVSRNALTRTSSGQDTGIASWDDYKTEIAPRGAITRTTSQNVDELKEIAKPKPKPEPEDEPVNTVTTKKLDPNDPNINAFESIARSIGITSKKTDGNFRNSSLYSGNETKTDALLNKVSASGNVQPQEGDLTKRNVYGSNSLSSEYKSTTPTQQQAIIKEMQRRVDSGSAGMQEKQFLKKLLKEAQIKKLKR